MPDTNSSSPPAGIPAALLADLQLAPALNLLRLCAMAASPEGALDADTLALLARQVRDGVLDQIDPCSAWPELARGLMGEAPSRMLHALRECGALSVVLPEVDALSGMPLADSTGELVDLGAHLSHVLDLLARQGASLPLRFAALAYQLGKADSPPEHLPTHYKHVERAVPRIEAIGQRFQLPAAYLELALLCTHELERIHKATEMRAGALAMLLERVDAFGQAQRFGELLMLCEMDYLAFPSSHGKHYPKAAMLRAALAAAEAAPAALTGDALNSARADAIAQRLRSLRWSGAEN